MGAEDDEIRLVFKTSGFEALENIAADAGAATNQLSQFDEAVDELRAGLSKAPQPARSFASALASLNDEALAFKTHVESTAAPTARLTQAVDKTTKATANLSHEILTAGRAFQDFAQGGVGGVLNNIEGLLIKFPAAAGVVTILATAAWAAAPAFRSLWNEVVNGSNEVPKAADKLTAMNDALKANKDRLKELAEQHTLTNAELAEYNRLTAETAELETKANAARERRNALEAARKEERGGSADSAAIAKAAIAQEGGTDAFVNDAQTALQNDSAGLKAAVRRLDEARRKGAEAAQNPLNVAGAFRAAREIGAARKALKDAAEAVRAEAEDLVVKARSGDVDAIRRLSSFNPGSAISQALPENIRAQDAEVQAADDQGDALHRAGAARRANAAAGRDRDKAVAAFNARNNDARLKGRLDADKRVDDLNDEGRANQAAMQDRIDRDAAKAAAEAKRAAKASTPRARLAAFRDRAYDSALGVGMAENDGEFSPGDLDSIAREAADSTPDLGLDSIRQAVYRAAALTRAKNYAEMTRSMGRMNVQSDSFISPYD